MFIAQDTQQSKGDAKTEIASPREASAYELRIELENYSSLISSQPPAKHEEIKAQLGRVAAAVKSALGLPNDATVDLSRYRDNKAGEIMKGMIKIPGQPKPIEVSLGIDSTDGSIVIGKPLNGEATIAGFNLGVRLLPHEMKERCGKIREALTVLPAGFSVIGFTDKGEVIAFNRESNGMMNLGNKDHFIQNTRVVGFNEEGLPSISKPLGLRVEQASETGVTQLRISQESGVSFVNPFPASSSARQVKWLLGADALKQLINDPNRSLGQGGNDIPPHP